MALLRCCTCTCTFAVGLHRCPQCTGTSVEEVGAMPKIHRDRPPTYEADIPTPEQTDEQPPAGEQTPAARKRTRKGSHTRAQAGPASGDGAASS